jgi:hypothetical protein
MDTALRLMNQALRSFKPPLPDMRTRPHLALPVLPPRDSALSHDGQRRPTKVKTSRRKATVKRKPAPAKRARRKR